MADYTFTLTDVQDAALRLYVAEQNRARVDKGLPEFADNGEFVEAQVVHLLAPAVERFNSTQAEELSDLLRRVDSLPERAKARAILEAAAK